MTDLYMSLGYEEYKRFEEQLENHHLLETVHEAMDRRYYHKSFRLQLGDVVLEVHGPSVKAPTAPTTIKATLGKARPA